MIVRIAIVALFVCHSVFAQGLMEERIWKISGRKKSIFLDSGVFHSSSTMTSSGITGIRNSVVAGRGYERIVIDFNTPGVPKIYGHISAQKHNISVDFFNTQAMTAQPQIKNSKFVKSVDFISVDGKTLTMEMTMKAKASFDIFYLDNPGRLVIDIR
jgi:hypothetical protein